MWWNGRTAEELVAPPEIPPSAADFWERCLGGESHVANDAAFVTGFALAAVAFFSEVRDEL